MNDAEQADRSAPLRQQTVLAKFGELALQSESLDEILAEACRLVGDVLGTDLAIVMELQEDGTSLSVRAGVGWKPGLVGKVTLTATNDSSEGHALRTGEPMISPDVETETRFTYSPFLIENGVKAVANVVIIGGQGRPPFGILQIDSRKPRQFTDTDTDFLRGYANLLAAAVDRLRVIGEVRDGEARLRLALDAAEMGSWDLDLLNGSARRSSRHDQIFGYLERRWCTRQIQGEMAPNPRLLCDDRLATDGIWASGRQHPVQHRHADGSLGLLGGEAAGPQPGSDQRLVATHCRFH